MEVPAASEIARRYVKFAPVRAERFEEGVRNPGKNWEKETADAEGNYEEGVKKGIARKAFGKGVKKCGTAKQMARTIKNAHRWPEGIADSEEEMTSAMEPVVVVMKAVKLPERYPRGDPRNYERVKAVGMALRKAKEEGRI